MASKIERQCTRTARFELEWNGPVCETCMQEWVELNPSEYETVLHMVPADTRCNCVWHVCTHTGQPTELTRAAYRKAYPQRTRAISTP